MNVKDSMESLSEEELDRVEQRLAELLGSSFSTTDLADYASRELVRLIAAVRAAKQTAQAA